MAVFVLDKRQKPLMPCSEKRASLLLRKGRARVHKLMPFTIRLVDRTVEQSSLQPVELKLDPGYNGTGMAIVRVVEKEVEQESQESTPSGKHIVVISLFELFHRGQTIRDRLTARRNFRRRRRGNLRYRAPRFLNRTKPAGWLAPSLQHRVDTTLSQVERLRKLVPITGIAVETAKFDTQALQNPEISGAEYQQGELAGFQVREYLLEKWNRCCAYCGAKNTPLNIDHIVAKARGGSDRVSNLTLACIPCNQAKGAQDVRDFLKNSPTQLAKLLSQAKRSLASAASMNATRNALLRGLAQTGLVVEAATGAQTKFNRSRLGVPKTHATDAACVGNIEILEGWKVLTLQLKSTGRGSYCRTRLDRFGFPRGRLTRQKRIHGFATGDMVKAKVPTGKKMGVYTGRVAVRKTGSFNIQTHSGVVQGISHKYCQLLQRADGYSYNLTPFTDSKTKGGRE